MSGTWGGTLWGGRRATSSPTPTPTPTPTGGALPGFPDVAFLNAITVRLCDDAGNVEGGENPVAGSPISFPASVQDRGSRWEARHGLNINVSNYTIYFQTNPDLALSRPIRNGDQIEHDGDILTVVDRVKNRGGYGALWRLKCELVNT